MIPSYLTQENILSGIKKIDKEEFDPKRESDDFDLFYNDKQYPPKVVISYSHYFIDNTEWSSKKFNGGPETNTFLINRHFPVNLKKDANPTFFFTELEMLFFMKIAGTPYNEKKPVDRNAGIFIKKYIWEKTHRWAELLAGNNFIITGKKQWNERTKNGQRFKPYTWFRLHLIAHHHDRLFYSVGVSSKGELVIKIDCQRHGQDKLADYQVNYLDQILQAAGAERKIISPAQLKDFNWENLVTFSQLYIKQTLPVYKKLVEWLNHHIEEKCARICWNEKDWEQPSGPEGKSTTSSNSQEFIHERDNRFAPEEWLFDFDKQIDGYCYGRIEPVHTDRDKHIGKTYHLTLFTRDSQISKWYWVGRIENALVINHAESVRIAAIFKTKGWFNERLVQLQQLENVNADSFENWEPGNLFNIRFRATDVSLFGLQPFVAGEKPPTPYYNLPFKEADPLFQGQPPSGNLILTPPDTDERTPKRKIKKKFTEHFTEIDNIHGLIQHQLLADLMKKFPGQVFKECRKEGYETRVDIVHRAKRKTVLYEIKTYPNVLYSIRVALGQLLEYAYFPDLNLATEFIIVTHLKADPIHLEYLAYISNRLGLNISYLWYKPKQ